jgi:4-amino-4-deoxy-L-arabinose transferase-like glycosyltransferase
MSRRRATGGSRQALVGRGLAVILVLFVFLGTGYAIVTPVFEASDELWHYPMVRHLADGNPLPVQVFDPDAAGPWKQQASQPPLYYYLGAALTFWVDTADVTRIRRLNPHVNTGTIPADGNINLVVHDPAANPWQGTLLAVRIVRWFSVLLGAVTVFLTYQIARAVAPGRPEIALGAAAVNAFTPMFLFISGAVNNDNLVIPLASLALLLMIRAVQRHGIDVEAVLRNETFHRGIAPESTLPEMNDERRTTNMGRWALVVGRWSSDLTDWMVLGAVIGLAALTKISAVGLLFLALGTIFVTRWQSLVRPLTLSRLLRLLIETLGRFLLLLLPLLLIAGWWYYRNIALYGDWTGWNAFIAVLGQRPQPATLGQLWSERAGFLASYWGLFGGLNVPMPGWIYTVLNLVLLTAVLGFPLYLWQQLFPKRKFVIGNRPLAQGNYQLLITNYFPLLLCLLWSAAVVYGLIQWATLTWSSQGRLVFTAISALTTLLVLGLAGWLPRRPATAVIAVLATFLFIISAAAPFAWIRPAYQPHRYTQHWLAPTPTNVDFGGQMRLVDYEIKGTAPAHAELRPGGRLDLLLQWEVLAPMDRDWSVFVHLNDPVLGAPIAQRDMYPDHGLRPTSLLPAGERIFNLYRLAIPDTAVAPAELTLMVGLYDFYTGERLAQADGRDAANLAILPLTAVPGEYPNALSQNFGNELELVGFDFDSRRVPPGDTLAVTLYWRPLRPLRTDYTFFAQVVDLDGDLTRWASDDPAPAAGTSGWRPGETQTVTFRLPLADDTPPRLYPLIIGVYTQTAAGTLQRLQLVTADGRVTDQDYLLLTQVRVEG